ncbi:hypothetical protein HPB50_011285 [Hyalomma asiaticum]|uniref:Uncharacterized protein n=1 Tax=Hyalomma asiaticum TaxID=266040 RepID=A0ACB7TKZ6_HYAAI|nr:hypothetical protein HPB50_011285 [Hyalomma asiaticum]
MDVYSARPIHSSLRPQEPRTAGRPNTSNSVITQSYPHACSPRHLASARARVRHAESAATRSFVLACPESFVRRPGPRQPVPKAQHVLSSGCPRAGPRPASAPDQAETSRLSPCPVVLLCPGLRKNWFVWYVLARSDEVGPRLAHPCAAADASPRSFPKPERARSNSPPYFSCPTSQKEKEPSFRAGTCSERGRSLAGRVQALPQPARAADAWQRPELVTSEW